MIDVKVLNSLTPIFADRTLSGGEIERIMACRNQSVNFQLAFTINDNSAQSCDFYIRFDTDLPLGIYYINNVPVVTTGTLFI